MNAQDPGYEYVNARLRAMKTRLLSPPDYDVLLASSDIETLIGRLDKTPYGAALEQVLPTQSGVLAVLQALHVDFSAALRRIHRFCGGATAAAWELLLAQTLRHNVITLLRGVDARADPKQIVASLIDVPPFTEAQLVTLARQPMVRSLIELLSQWHLPTPALADALVGALLFDVTLTELEVVYEQAWATTILSRTTELGGDNGDLLHGQFSSRLDLINLGRMLNLQGLEIDPLPSWLPGGSLPPQTLERLRMAADTADMRSILGAAQPNSLWLPDLELWTGQRSALLQAAWESTFARWQVGLLGRADPLGVGVMIGYQAAKETEVRNLRLIAQAVAGSLSRADAHEQLLLLI